MLKVSVWCVAMLAANVAMAEQVAPPPASRPPTAPRPTPVRKPPTAPRVTVVMTAATLADDCGGAAPAGGPTFAAPPPPITASLPASEPKPKPDPDARAKADAAYEVAPTAKAKSSRRCEQTSMQLTATASAGVAPTSLKVKKVELFDESGASLGVLTARTPRVWSVAKGAYLPWHGTIRAGQTLNVSYVLSQPALGPVGRHDMTYTVKATVTVGGGAQTVSKDVHIAAPTILPPNVKT